MLARWASRVALGLMPCLGVLFLPAPSGAQNKPLAVIDWLENQPRTKVVTAPRPARPTDEAPVSQSATQPKVTVAPLGTGAPRVIGLVPQSFTGLPDDIWLASDAARVAKRLDSLPEITLPVAQSLLYKIVLAEAHPPRGLASEGDQLALARAGKLMDMGAVDPALALIEQAGITTSPAHFALWMDLSLLVGTEDRACATWARSPHLSADYAVRIFCAARIGDWDNAALTFGSAQALGLMPAPQLALLDRYLNPDLFEDAAPLPKPRRMDPLTFRLFETIGEALPTTGLPRAYAVADLRDLAGWKAQLAAAERLTRSGALPDNRLLGIYTDREPAASGGIWDRVEALQRFETAMNQKNPAAISKTLPGVWTAMREAGLETSFAALFADDLLGLPLQGRAATIAFDVILLSSKYETAALAPAPPLAQFLMDVATGTPKRPLPDHPNAAAIYAGFTTHPPKASIMSLAKDKNLGEALLQVIEVMQKGFEGDRLELQNALASLRALGLEDYARRAALQAVLLR